MSGRRGAFSFSPIVLKTETTDGRCLFSPPCLFLYFLCECRKLLDNRAEAFSADLSLPILVQVVIQRVCVYVCVCVCERENLSLLLAADLYWTHTFRCYRSVCFGHSVKADGYFEPLQPLCLCQPLSTASQSYDADKAWTQRSASGLRSVRYVQWYYLMFWV